MRYKGGETTDRERYDRYLGAIEFSADIEICVIRWGETADRDSYDRYIGAIELQQIYRYEI